MCYKPCVVAVMTNGNNSRGVEREREDSLNCRIYELEWYDVFTVKVMAGENGEAARKTSRKNYLIVLCISI